MIKIAVAVVVFVLALSGGASATAATFTDCSAPLVDQTSKKVLDSSKVESAITAADQKGVDLYVRAFQTVPDGSLDQYWQDGVQTCANWRSGTGSDARPKGNVALVAFSIDRKSAIFYGPVYDDLIGNTNANAIRTQMGSFFRNGDFTGGVTYAAGRIGTLAAGNTSPVGQSGDQPADAPIISGEAATSVGRVILIALATALAVALISLIYVLIMARLRKRRSARDAVTRARTDALAARKKAGSYVTKWSGDALTTLDSELELELIELPESRQAVHRRSAAGVKLALNGAMDGFGQMVQKADVDIESSKLTRQDYERETARYDDVNNRFADGEADLEKFRKDVHKDVSALSPAKQGERSAGNVLQLNRLAAQFDQYAKTFTVGREKDLAIALAKGATRTAEFARTASDPVKALEMIEADERGITELKDIITTVGADHKRLADPLGAMRTIVETGRRKVRQSAPSSDKFDLDLQKIDDDLRSKLRFFGPDKDRRSQMGVLDRLQSQVDTIVRQAKKASDEDDRKRRRDREVEVSRRRPSYGGSSDSSGFGSSFGGGFIGGALGSSFGNSGGSSSGDSGGSSFGGSSGGFDGGGSSGGGDSGGW